MQETRVKVKEDGKTDDNLYTMRTGYQGASRLRDGKSRATHIVDERLKVIAEMINLRGTDVLDIGCNTGYITVQIGTNFTWDPIMLQILQGGEWFRTKRRGFILKSKPS